jgi:hypothetical protein
MATKQIGRHSAKGGVHNILDWDKKKVKGKDSVILCGSCGAIYYDKHWHTNDKMSAVLKKQKGVMKELCQECKMSKDTKQAGANFEGEVILKNIGTEEKTEILNLINNIGGRATKRDPEDRILMIEEKKNEIRVLTSENQLAVAIGKQVARAFKGGELEIKFSEGDKVARAVWSKK